MSEIIRLIMMKMKMKNRSVRYNINRSKPKFSKSTFGAQFMKKLSNTEARLKKGVAYIKKSV